MSHNTKIEANPFELLKKIINNNNNNNNNNN